jgi:hypothetical protein
MLLSIPNCSVTRASNDTLAGRRYLDLMIITRIGAAASPFAETWSKLAVDPDQQIKVRLGALRGIAALGKTAPNCSEKMEFA